MTSTAIIDLFNKEFNFIKETNIFGVDYYNIIEDLKNKPLDYENSLRIEIGNYIKNYINKNIEKIPFEPDKFCNLLNFDYKSIELRLNNIKSIHEIEIKSMKLINKNDSFKLLITHDVYYKNNNNTIKLLLPQLRNPVKLDLSLIESKKNN